MKITFFGAVEEVTGSRYLVEDNGTRILVDCGLFQGALRKHNWDPFPIDLNSIDAIVLTHAHIDHTGYIPLLVKNGYRGKIYCSKATYALCAIMLVDSGFLQEEEAKNVNEARYSRHSPALPLYTAADAKNSLNSFQVVDYDAPQSFGSLTVTLIASYHILGASFIIISDGKEKLTFSGDLAGPNQLIMKSPPYLKQTDYLVLESTYGNRLHEEGDPMKVLGDVINKTAARGGVVIIPSFAVGRAQTLLYCLSQLKHKKVIPDIPIFLDSPMAISVSNLFCQFKDEHQLPAQQCTDIFSVATYIRNVQESKRLNQLSHAAVIIAGSGMATGGRVLDHLRHFISDAKNTVLFVGFQARGTLGRLLVDGASEVRIYGTFYTVHAEIENMESVSAHADYNEILTWLSSFEHAPKKVFLTHGELDAAQALKKKIEKQFGWSVVIPKYSDSFDLE